MKQHTIIGTAGHIDHGKTALIKALTGIDADRLKEEKERGITIDIGFAYWRDDVTIIDVPGHEKFIRNMVAGVSTIDFFILVIAADDGIMPQTVEHLDILNFFNITNGLVLINKIDLVDREWLDLINEEIIEMLTGYGLGDIPVILCSAQTGENIDRVRQAVEDKIAGLSEQTTTRPFRLLVDRSFSIKGYGTVATGTVLSGTLSKGDEVHLMPDQRLVKVRGIQTHTTDVSQVFPGFRAAVNLQGVSKEEVIRGNIICAPDTMMPVREFTGIIKTIQNIPLKKIANRSRVHIYVGTTECAGQLVWYDDEKHLKENSSFHVRIKLDHPVGAARNDAFLVRLHSPVITLAGGKVLEINPGKIKHEASVWQAYFTRVDENELPALIAFLLNESKLNPLSVSDLQKKIFEDRQLIEEALTVLQRRKNLRTITRGGQEYYVSEPVFNALLDEITGFLDSYHTDNPHMQGVNQKELVNGIGKNWLMPELIEAALRKLVNSELIRIDKNIIALIDFKPRMGRDTAHTTELLLSKLYETNFSPPTSAELATFLETPEKEIRSLLAILAKEQKIISIQGQFFLHTDVWKKLLAFLNQHFAIQKDLTVPELKEFIQTTRKYAIPLIEHLDSEGYTERSGDMRRRGLRLE